MALFSKKTAKKDGKKDVVKAETATSVPRDLGHVIVSPRITEKATLQSGGNVYVFNVASGATKPEIKAAFLAHYKVSPARVRVVNTKGTATRNMRTGKKGMTSGFRKAYIYLKKGDTISIT